MVIFNSELIPDCFPKLNDHQLSVSMLPLFPTLPFGLHNQVLTRCSHVVLTSSTVIQMPCKRHMLFEYIWGGKKKN